MSLSAFHCGGEDGDIAAIVGVGEFFNQLRLGIANHLFAGDIRVGCGHAGKQKSQKIIYFRDGTDGGAGVLVGGFLFDGDDRIQSRNLIHVGMLVVAHKLAGVGREGLHVAALSFRINRVEC